MRKLAVIRQLPDSANILYPAASAPFPRPLYSVPAGYPSAAQDYVEQELDLNGYMLGPRRASVFFFRIGGDSMKDAGILHDDIIIVDRSLEVLDGHIVVASLFGEFTCKYYRRNSKGVWLVPANSEYKSIRITEEMEFTVFGRFNGLVRKATGRTSEPFSVPTAD
jgi:DNA polymerase V